MTEEHTKPVNQTTIHVLAGIKPDGDLVYEDIVADELGDNCYRLLSSPLFVRGIAKGDTIRLLTAGKFEVEQRSGNLCVRVLARSGLQAISDSLALQLPALKAELDYRNERTLVYSMPVTVGFEAIEEAFNKALENAADQAIWLYANVYDPADGETPLNWWQEFLVR